METQWKYVANPSHVRHEILDIEPEATYEEKSLQILDRNDLKLKKELHL